MAIPISAQGYQRLEDLGKRMVDLADAASKEVRVAHGGTEVALHWPEETILVLLELLPDARRVHRMLDGEEELPLPLQRPVDECIYLVQILDVVQGEVREDQVETILGIPVAENVLLDEVYVPVGELLSCNGEHAPRRVHCSDGCRPFLCEEGAVPAITAAEIQHMPALHG